VADEAETLPKMQDLSVLRLEIENRGGRSRLLVDFTAYAPGFLQLPPLEIASFVFTGLEVEIASILDAETGPGGASRVLSPPAPPLSAPGTMVLIYAALFGIIGFILLSAAMGIWGFPFLRLYRAELKRRRLIRSMEKFLRQLRFDLKDTPEPAEDGAAVVLDRLDREFRLFLKAVTGLPCDTMTPPELALLKLDFPVQGEGREAAPYGGVFLEGLFSRSDLFRFSGGIAPKSAALAILDEVQGFVSAVAGDGA
jgi:hypothetical protein